MITGIFSLLFALIHFYALILLVACIFSFLYAFGILDNRNRVVWRIGDFLYRITEPVLRPVRRIVPQFGNVDLSPLIVLLVLQYLLPPLLLSLEALILTGSTQTFFS